MDIGTDVQRKFDNDDASRNKEARREMERALMTVEADLTEAVRLCDALKELEDFHAWVTFRNIILSPSLTKVRKEIEDLNRELGKKDVKPEEKQKISAQLIYDNSFYEILLLMSDFEHIRKDNQNKQKLLQSRIKELNKQLEKNAKG
jgi:hypothetical protein